MKEGHMGLECSKMAHIGGKKVVSRHALNKLGTSKQDHI